jgi:hypothetical protein
MRTLSGEFRARASLRQALEKIRWRGRVTDALRVVLTITADGNEIEIATWYVQGEGPVRQEHRTNGRLDVALRSLGLDSGS